MSGKLYEVCGYPGAIESSDANHKVFGGNHSHPC